MRERYIPSDNQWIAFPEFDVQAFFEAVNTDVGTPVPITVHPDGTVVVDFDDLPPGVTENEVKQTIRDNHPHR